MSKIANCKITVQCESADMAHNILEILEVLADYELFNTGVSSNTREPFIDGVHLSVFYKLPEDEASDSI